MIIIIWLVAKHSQRLLYVILRRSGTKKNKREISHPSREISRGFLGKGKKSIDLESVVIQNKNFYVLYRKPLSRYQKLLSKLTVIIHLTITLKWSVRRWISSHCSTNIQRFAS